MLAVRFARGAAGKRKRKRSARAAVASATGKPTRAARPAGRVRSAVRRVSTKQQANWARFAKAARSGVWKRRSSSSRDAAQDRRLAELEADARIDQFIHRPKRRRKRVNYQNVSRELDAVLHNSPGVF